MNKFKVGMFLLGIIVLIGVIIYSNPLVIAQKLANSDYRFIALSFGISVLAISMGVLKWKLLLNRVGFFELYPVQLLGYTISNFSPGKAAEPAKAIVLKMRSNIPVSFSLSSIIWERMMDIVSLLLLSLIALNNISLNSSFFLPTLLSIGAFLVIVIVGFLTLYNEKFGRRLFAFVKKLPVLKKLPDDFADMFYKNRVEKKTLVKCFFLTFTTWVVIGTILYTSLLAFGYNISPLILCGVVALSVVVGIASSLPGGLGTTELVMIFLLGVLGVDSGAAAAATILFRLATIWFVNILGGLSFLYLSRKFELKNLLS